jgi:hypothetical protein
MVQLCPDGVPVGIQEERYDRCVCPPRHVPTLPWNRPFRSRDWPGVTRWLQRDKDQGACSGFSVVDERPKFLGQGQHHGQAGRGGSRPPEDAEISHLSGALLPPVLGESASRLVPLSRPLPDDGAPDGGYVRNAPVRGHVGIHQGRSRQLRRDSLGNSTAAPAGPRSGFASFPSS